MRFCGIANCHYTNSPLIFVPCDVPYFFSFAAIYDEYFNFTIYKQAQMYTLVCIICKVTVLGFLCVPPILSSNQLRLPYQSLSHKMSPNLQHSK